jgi:serine/threonine-protein kinase RsbW
VTGAYPVLHVGSFGSAGPVRSTRPWTRTFRGMPASVPEARRFVAELLAGCPAREVLMTCVSELCANAIAHTDSGNGGVFIVEVDLPRPGVARIAVTDEGGPSLPAARSLDLMAEGGRGLAMVAACTSRWGYADAYPGRTVWAEACWPVPVSSPGPVPVSSPGPVPVSSPGPVPSPGQAAPGNPSHRFRLPLPRSPRSSRPSRSSRSSSPPPDWPPDGWPSGPAA